MATSDSPTSPDVLYGLPREDFVAARAALAKTLAAAGDKAGAAEVKQLKKPSVSAAAINLVARKHPDAVVGLLDAGTELRHAQEEALGGGPADGLREATRNLAAAVDEVAKLAAELGGVSAAQRDRIATTLRAAATDDDAADLLRRGVLVEDLEAAGFGLGGAPPPPRKAGKPVKKAEDKAAAEALAEARRALRVAEDEADTAERRAARQAERAEEAERRAEEAAAAAQEAQADAKRMATEAKDARKQADDAAARLERLQRDG